MSFNVIHQAEAAECGLACIAMVAEAHGSRISLSALRRQFSLSLSGSNLTGLIAIADTLGFTARAVRCDLDELSLLQTPAILHWDLDHYVVLRRVSGKQVWIADPARGDRKLTLDEVSRSFTGIALELTPAPNFEKKVAVERVALGDLWTRFSGLRRFLMQMILLTLLLQAVGLLTPLATQLVVDDVIGRSDRDLLFVVVFGFSALILVQTAISTLRGFVQLHAGQRLSIQLSGNLLRHLLRLPTSFFERRHIGDIMSRFGSLAPAQSFLTGGIVGTILDAILVVPVGAMMIVYSPILSVLLALDLLIIFFVRWVTFPKIRRFADEILNLSAKTDSIFLETIRGSRAIKIAGREAERLGIWQNAVADQQNTSYRQSSFSLWGGTGLSIWQGLHGIAMLYFGALQVIDGKITLGMYFAFQSYAAQFSGRVNGLVSSFFTYKMLGLHLTRLADIIYSDPEPGIDGPSRPVARIQGEIQAVGLKFRYGDHEPWVLEDVSFSVQPGESVVLVGPSGCGKSTLLKLLIGIYPPVSGEVRIDDRPLGAMALRALRAQIGVVMQDDQMLSGTIIENIGFFDSNIDVVEAENACRKAHIHDEILKMPMGYNSLVGDMGSILSGGQKQRLLLARALYKKPSILFMDEGTANLDPDLERAVMGSLAALGITCVMVAHRMAVVEAADRILRVEHGRVIEIPRAMVLP